MTKNLECYKIVFGKKKLNFDDLFNLSSAVQPALTISISYMLSQQSVIHINIYIYIYILISESYGTGIVYQDLLLRLGD